MPTDRVVVESNLSALSTKLSIPALGSLNQRRAACISSAVRFARDTPKRTIAQVGDRRQPASMAAGWIIQSRLRDGLSAALSWSPMRLYLTLAHLF